MADQEAQHLLHLHEVLKRTGTKHAKHYADIAGGLMVKPVKRGSRFARWPANEVAAIVTFRVAGCDDSAVRDLVTSLHRRRQEAAHAVH